MHEKNRTLAEEYQQKIDYLETEHQTNIKPILLVYEKDLLDIGKRELNPSSSLVPKQIFYRGH